MATMTLKEAARIMERDHGCTIKIGNFENFDAFLSYFGAHYKPLLKQLAEEWAMATDARRFFTDDILDAFDPTNEL